MRFFRTFSRNVQQVAEQAEVCNERKYEAKAAQDESGKLFMSVFIETHGPFIEDGVVFRVLNRSVDVFMPRLSLEERVYCDKLETAKSLSHDVDNNCLRITWKHNSAGIQVSFRMQV